MPRALYWTLNQGSSAKHQLYRDVAVEEARKGLQSKSLSSKCSVGVHLSSDVKQCMTHVHSIHRISGYGV